MATRVYIAHAMTGRNTDELLYESKLTANILSQWGLSVSDPVTEEAVQPGNLNLQNSSDVLKNYWKRDKQMIREAHVLLDLTGPAKSEGVAHEIGYARFCLWKPVIRVYPKGLGPSVAWFEDDAIVSCAADAARIIVERWGSPLKRFQWRVLMLLRCLPKWIWYQIKEWK